jgi:hypothetical protein
MSAAKKPKRMSALMEELSPKKTFWERYRVPLSFAGVGSLCVLCTAGIMGLYMLKNTLTPDSQPEPTSLSATVGSAQTPASVDACINPNYNCEPTNWDFILKNGSNPFSRGIKTITGYAGPNRMVEMRYSIVDPSPTTFFTPGGSLCDLAGNLEFKISGPGVDQSLPNAKNDTFSITGHDDYSVLINTGKGGNYTLTLTSNNEYICGAIKVTLFLSEGIWEHD